MAPNMMMPCPIGNHIAAISPFGHSNEDENLGDGEYYVENIIDKRVMYECEVRYRVKWIGYPFVATTWENIDNLSGSLESVYTFERRRASTAGNRFSTRVKKEDEQLNPSRVAEKHEELRQSGAKVVAVVGFLTRKKQFVVMYDNHKIIALEPSHYQDLSQQEKDLCIQFLSVQMYAHSADRKRAYDMVHSMPVPEKKEEPKEEEKEMEKKKDSYPTSSRKRTWESINQTIAPVSVIKSQFGEPEKKEEKVDDEEMQQEVPISSSSNNTNKKEEEDMEVEETIPQKEEPRCSKRQRRAPNWIKT